MPDIDLKLSVHHVGARYGNSSFPVTKSLEKGLVQVLYDADEDCLDEVEAYNAESESEIHVLPYCFSNESQKGVPFHINLDPFTSSLYKLNEEYKERYVFIYGSDYPLKEGFSVNNQISIDTTTMDDEFYFNEAASLAAPDFLSLDVQGAEYDILQGAENVLRESVLAVCLEVEFVPLYKDQACFGQLCEYMDSLGFAFARFLDIHEFSPHRGPIGTRAKGFHSYANALFLRKVESIEAKQTEPEKDLMFKKLAFISVLFDQMEFGLSCLNKCSDNHFRDQTATEELPRYLEFIEELSATIQANTAKYPVSFKDVVSNKNCEDYPGKEYFAHVYQLEKVMNYLFQRIESQPKQYSQIENTLLAYGLTSQANIIWTNRIQQSLFDDELGLQLIEEISEYPPFFTNLIKYFKSKTTEYDANSLKYLSEAVSNFELLSKEQCDLPKQNLLYSLGSFLKSIHQQDMSRLFFEKLLAIKNSANDVSQQTSFVYFHLGELELQSGNRQVAAQHFSNCLDILPSHRKAAQYLKQLQE